MSSVKGGIGLFNRSSISDTIDYGVKLAFEIREFVPRPSSGDRLLRGHLDKGCHEVLRHSACLGCVCQC